MYNLNQMVVILCLSKDETTSQNNGKREEVEVVEISEKLSLRGSSWEFGRRREQRINKRMKNRAKENDRTTIRVNRSHGSESQPLKGEGGTLVFCLPMHQSEALAL